MHLHCLIFSLLSLSCVGFSLPGSVEKLPLVESNKLRRALTRSALLQHADKLYGFSREDPDGNRAFGGKGHNLTVDYLYDTFAKGPLATYYTVEKQEFVHEYSYGTSNVVVEGDVMESAYFTYSPSTGGNVTLPLGATENLGCSPVSTYLLIEFEI